MKETIDYYFSLVSPWAYLGHAHFLEVANRFGVGVAFKPVNLPPVFEVTGGLPLSKRNPVRQRYRQVELQRWRDKRGVALNVWPKFWPFDVGLADRVVVAADLAKADTGALVQRLFEAVWVKEQNLADPQTIAAALKAEDLDASALLAAADTPAIQAAYAENGRRAIAADVFGSPSYVRDGEVFWGQDRIDMLAEALAARRPAYRPLK